MIEYQEYDSETFVKMSKHAKAFNLIHRLYKNERSHKQVGILVGETGVGKTALVEFFIRNYSTNNPKLTAKPIESLGGTVLVPNIDVLHVSAPPSQSKKDIQTKILEALGDDAAKGTTHVLNNRISKTCKAFGVKLVIIDETHKLLYTTNGQKNKEMFNLFQDLLDNYFGCDLLLVGTGRLVPSLKYSPEFHSRVVSEVELKYYSSDSKENRDHFKKFVKYSFKPLPYGHLELTEDNFIRLFFACNGKPRNLKKIITTAYQTRTYSEKLLSVEDLHDAYEDHLESEKILVNHMYLNPFNLYHSTSKFAKAIGWPYP